MKISTETRHLDTPRNALATGCCDFGIAKTVDGTVYDITWGRNLDAEQIKFFEDKTIFEPIEVAPGVFELILPTREA